VSAAVRYSILESGSGDVLGSVEIAEGIADEIIVTMLVESGYLQGSPDNFSVDYNYSFMDGSPVVIDLDTDEPVITLEMDEGDTDDEENA
jgi:hypothetical protein